MSGDISDTLHGCTQRMSVVLPSTRPPRGLLLYIHGLNDCGTRMCAPCALQEGADTHGLLLAAVDACGHGVTATNATAAHSAVRGYVPSASHALAGVLHAVAHASLLAHCARVPLFLLGASFGATLTLHACTALRAHAATRRGHELHPAVAAWASEAQRASDAAARDAALPWLRTAHAACAAHAATRAAADYHGCCVAGILLHAPLVRVSEARLPPAALRPLAHAAAALFPTLPLIPSVYGEAYHPAVRTVRTQEDAAQGVVYTGRVRLGTGVSVLDAVSSLQPGAVTAPTGWAVQAHEDGDVAISPHVMIQHGTDDALCALHDTRTFVRAWDAAAAQVGMPSIDLRVYDGAHHDLLRERQAVTDHVVQDAMAWIEKRLQDDSIVPA